MGTPFVYVVVAHSFSSFIMFCIASLRATSLRYDYYGGTKAAAAITIGVVRVENARTGTVVVVTTTLEPRSVIKNKVPGI